MISVPEPENLVSKLKEKFVFGSGRPTSSSTLSRALGQCLRLLGSRVESESSFSGQTVATVAGDGGSSPESGDFGAVESVGVWLVGPRMLFEAIVFGKQTVKETCVRKIEESVKFGWAAVL